MSEGVRRWLTREARAARREAYWNRARPPRDWRYWVGGAGRVLIVTGLLMFGFVAYQLWGTGLEYNQAQNRLDDELEELFAQAGTVPTTAAPAPTSAAVTTATAGSTTADPTTGGAPTTTSASTSSTSSTTTTAASTVPAAVPEIREGAGFARLEMPSIGVDAVIVAGVKPNDLKAGPGHYPGTPMPGQLGNSSIACHRTTYGAPCFRLDELGAGDEIIVTTVQGRFVYTVTGGEVVPPNRGDVVLTTDPTVAQLTLTTCDPVYTATNRLIVRAELDPTGGTPAQPADLDYGSGDAPAAVVPTLPGEEVGAPLDTAPPGTTPASTANSTPGSAPAATAATTSPTTAATIPVTTAAAGPITPTEVEDAFAQGWFDDTAAWPHVAGWGLLATAVAGLGYLVARLLRRRWVGWAVAAVPFALTLYFFYQNVNRLLPAAI